MSYEEVGGEHLGNANIQKVNPNTSVTLSLSKRSDGRAILDEAWQLKKHIAYVWIVTFYFSKE